MKISTALLFTGPIVALLALLGPATSAPAGPAWQRPAAGSPLNAVGAAAPSWLAPDADEPGEDGPTSAKNPIEAECSTKEGELCSVTGPGPNPGSCTVTAANRECTVKGNIQFCTAAGVCSVATPGGSCSTFAPGQCSALGAGSCSTAPNGKCTAFAAGFCSVVQGAGGTCSTFSPGAGKCTVIGPLGGQCSTMTPSGVVLPGPNCIG